MAKHHQIIGGTFIVVPIFVYVFYLSASTQSPTNFKKYLPPKSPDGKVPTKQFKEETQNEIKASLETHVAEKSVLINGLPSVADNVRKITEVFKSEDKKTLTETELRNLLAKACEADLSQIMVQLDDHKDVVLPIEIYKEQLARNFTLKYSNPPTKQKTKAVIVPRQDIPRSAYITRLHDATESINVADLENHVKGEMQRRLQLGDDDALAIPEVISELNSKEFKIPNIIHFVWFGSGHRFRVDHFQAFIGALRYQKPKVILFHHDAVPVGEYWEEAKRFAGPVLKLVKRTPPSQIFGKSINVIEHKADVARLRIMIEIGGIYLDTDSVFLKSVDPLRNHEMIQAHTDSGILANGIILANRNAWFLRRWYHEYKYFQDSWWGLNSVLVPYALSRVFPDKIYVANGVMCRPSWNEVEKIFWNLIDIKPIYILHLYSRVMKAKDGIVERPLKQLAVLNTTYGAVARHVIWGEDEIRDVTDWIVTCNLTKTLRMGKKLEYP